MEASLTAKQWFDKGIEFGQAGSHGEAIFSLRQAIEINPEFAEAWYCLGIALGEMGRTEDELAAYNTAIQLNLKYLDAWNNKGVVLSRLGRQGEALDTYEKALEINPRFTEAWYNRGIALGRLRRYEEALAAYQKACEINPGYAKAWNNQGVTLSELGRYEEALAAYDKAIEINPEFAEAWNNKGAVLEKLERLEDAKTAFNRAAEIEPRYKGTLSKETATTDIAGTDGAAPEFQVEPEIAEPQAEAATEPAGAESQAEPPVTQIAGPRPTMMRTPTDYEAKMSELQRRGRLPEELAKYDSVIDARPKDAVAWNNRGVILGEMGRYEEALESVSKATKIKANSERAHLNKALLLARLNRHTEALTAAGKAIQINPGLAEAWLNKGNILVLSGKYEAALEATEKAIELKPGYAAAWNNKGVNHEHMGQPKEALYSFQKAIEIDPQIAPAYSNTAKMLFAFGALAQALENATMALSLDDEATSTLLLKGEIEIEMKDYAAASTSFTRAINRDLGNPLPVLWDIYARYLEAESSARHDSSQYRDRITGIIRQLKRARDLSGAENTGLKVLITYYLGCLHYKTDHLYEALDTLKKVEDTKAEPRTEARAHRLLDNIWNHAVRPTAWRWWLNSPSGHGWKKSAFSIIVTVILALLLSHPFIASRLPALPIDTAPYIVLVLFLMFILALPGIGRGGVRDFDVELPPPPAAGTVLATVALEMDTKGLDSYPNELK